MKSRFVPDRSGLSPRSVTGAYVLVMLTVFPLFTGFSGYGALTVSKFCFFALATGLWLLALLLLRRGRLSLSPARAAMVLFLALAALSTLLSPHRADSLLGAGRYDGLVTWLLYGGIFLGCSAYGRWQHRHSVGFGAAISLCCILALLQLAGLDPLWLYPGDLDFYDGHVRYTGQFLGTIGNTDLLSAVLSLAIPFFTTLYLCSREKATAYGLIPAGLSLFVLSESGVSAGPLALLITAVPLGFLACADKPRLGRALGCAALYLAVLSASAALSGSRGGWHFRATAASMALLAASLTLLALRLLLQAGSGPFPSPAALRKGLALLLLLLLAAGLLLLWNWPGTDGTLYEFSRLLHGHWDDSFGSSRLGIWRRTLELVPDAPLLGSGPGTLALRLDIRFSRYVEETGKTLETVADNAHNLYLQLLAENGLLGLAAYLLVLLSTARRCWQNRHHPLSLSLALAAFCYGVQSAFGLELCINAPLFWIFLSLSGSDIISSSDSED